MPGLIETNLDDIEIGERFREDLGDLTDLTESIKAKGLIQPITITSNNRLLTGHRRLEAARAAGLTSLPTIIRDVLDELDFREIELFENIHRKDLAWQERARLEQEIFRLKSEDGGMSQRDVAKATNQSVAGLNRHLQLARGLEIIPELANAKTEQEAWKQLSKIKEAAAIEELLNRADQDQPEIVKYFDYNFRVEDAIEALKGIDEGTFGWADVDPPYGVALHDTKRTTGEDDVSDYTEVEAKEYAKFIRSAAKQVYRVLKEDAFCIWWFGPTHFHTVKRELEKAGFFVHDVPAIWHRLGGGQTQQPDYNLANCYEPFFVCRKGSPKLVSPGRSNVFSYEPVTPTAKIHPTEKPLSLMVELVSIFCFPSIPIVIPFLGSGVTLAAAHQRKVPAMGWDLSEPLKKRAMIKAGEGY